MARRKATVYVDEDVLRATRVYAARADLRDSDVVEEALKHYLGIELLETVWERNADVDPGEVEALAVREVKAARKARG